MGFFFFLSLHTFAQSTLTDSLAPDKISVGVGAGYDFGGYGGSLIYYPQRSVGVFAGVGYAVAGVGYNVGFKLRALSHRSVTPIVPFVVGMYGYYAWAAPKGYSYFNKLFYGPTVGAGVDFRPLKSKFGYLTATVLLPIRTDDAKNYIEDLNTRQSISYSHKLHAVNASIGYKFIIR